MNSTQKPLIILAVIASSLAMLLMFTAHGQFFIFRPWLYANIIYWGFYFLGKRWIKNITRAYLFFGLFVCTAVVLVKMGELLVS